MYADSSAWDVEDDEKLFSSNWLFLSRKKKSVKCLPTRSRNDVCFKESALCSTFQYERVMEETQYNNFIIMCMVEGLYIYHVDLFQ